MPHTITVENHQPVPLRPLSNILGEPGTYLYVDRLVVAREFCDTEVEDDFGWVIVGDGHLAYFSGNLPTDLDDVDTDSSTGRWLQPGEVLHIRATNG